MPFVLLLLLLIAIFPQFPAFFPQLLRNFSQLDSTPPPLHTSTPPPPPPPPPAEVASWLNGGGRESGAPDPENRGPHPHLPYPMPSHHPLSIHPLPTAFSWTFTFDAARGRLALHVAGRRSW